MPPRDGAPTGTNQYVLLPIAFGIIIPGLQVAVSASTSGAAWKNAREYIELEGLGARRATGSPEHTTAIIAGRIGDTMKDTYGPNPTSMP